MAAVPDLNILPDAAVKQNCSTTSKQRFPDFTSFDSNWKIRNQNNLDLSFVKTHDR
jgi:hypothetical protein